VRRLDASRAAEVAALLGILALQALLFARPIRSATNYDEGVYLASLDALRHGQSLGSDVFASQLPGFYDLLRGLSYVTGIGLVSIRAGLLAVTVAGTVGGWLVGRRFGGPLGGLLTAGLLVVAPPLDLFGFQVIADTPALALTLLALGLATLPDARAVVAAGVVYAAALSTKLGALTALPTLAWFVRRRPWHALAGFAAVVVVLLVAHAGALGDLWSSGVTYHEHARSTPDVLEHPHRRIFDQIPRRTPFFWIAIAAAVTGIVFAMRRRPLRVWPLWTWVALTLLFLFTHKPLHDNHLIAFPFALAVASGATLGAALPRKPFVYALVGVVLAGAYVQQWRRVDLVRATKEPASNVAAADALERLVPESALVIDDRPIISFLAHRRVVGPLVDLALLRFQTRSLTDADVIRELPRARAVVVSRALRDRPRVLAAMRRDFRLRYDRGDVQIYVRETTSE